MTTSTALMGSFRPQTPDSPRWRPEEDLALKKASRSIHPLPIYLLQLLEIPIQPKFKHLKKIPELSTFSSKKIRDRFYEYASPKADRSAFTDEELRALHKYVKVNSSASWTELSKLLFQLPSNLNGTYRPPGLLKNRVNQIFTTQKIRSHHIKILPSSSKRPDKKRSLSEDSSIKEAPFFTPIKSQKRESPDAVENSPGPFVFNLDEFFDDRPKDFLMDPSPQ